MRHRSGCTKALFAWAVTCTTGPVPPSPSDGGPRSPVGLLSCVGCASKCNDYSGLMGTWPRDGDVRWYCIRAHSSPPHTRPHKSTSRYREGPQTPTHSLPSTTTQKHTTTVRTKTTNEQVSRHNPLLGTAQPAWRQRTLGCSQRGKVTVKTDVHRHRSRHDLPGHRSRHHQQTARSWHPSPP